MLSEAGGMRPDKQLRSGRKHGEIAGNLSLYCLSVGGAMRGKGSKKRGEVTG